MSAIRNVEFGEEISIVFKYKGEKEAFDEGIFVSESVGDDDDDYDDDYDYDFIREPRTEFEKSLSKMDGVLRQAEHDTQFLSHDLKVIESKNESTERRILKLTRDAAELRSRLDAFLNSFARRSSWRDHVAVTSSSEHMTMTSPPDRFTSSPRRHKATYAIFLKQNSVEQPVHVNIALHERESVLIY